MLFEEDKLSMALIIFVARFIKEVCQKVLWRLLKVFITVIFYSVHGSPQEIEVRFHATLFKVCSADMCRHCLYLI